MREASVCRFTFRFSCAIQIWKVFLLRLPQVGCLSRIRNLNEKKMCGILIQHIFLFKPSLSDILSEQPSLGT